MLFQVLFVFLLVMLAMNLFEKISNRKFKNIKVNRRVYPDRINIGESFNIELTIENKNKSHVPYLIVEEMIPEDITFIGNVGEYSKGNNLFHVSRYSVGRYQKKIRTYTLKANKRGAYIIKNLKVTLGDELGLNLETDNVYDFTEVLVYPKIKSIGNLKFDITNFQGDNTVRRWIFKDPMYIKGIRDYRVEDRMKDIHWKSTLKANKLMVKEYDYTSDEQLVIIINTQSGEFFWRDINRDSIEKNIEIAVALALKADKEGLETGIWSNAQLIYSTEKGPNEIQPKSGNFKKILEYCTRMSCTVQCSFDNYLNDKKNKLQREHTYVIISNFLDENSIGVIKEIIHEGYKIKLIDTSVNGCIPSIRGVEKIVYKGEINI